MNRTQHEASLCAALVDDVYGELPSRIITVLLHRGRLDTDVLTKSSGLTPGLLKKGLVVLIQQNLVYYYYDPITAKTYYDANWDAAFALARTGRIIDIVEARFGEDAKDVVQNLLLLGHTKVGDLVEAYKALLEKAVPKANGVTNGHTSGEGNDVKMTDGDNTIAKAKDALHKTGLTHEQLDDILYQLLQCGYLQPVTAALFKSPADTYHDIEQEVLRSNGGEKGSKGSKKAEAIKGLIRERLKEVRESEKNWRQHIKGNKRPRDAYDDSTGPDKRRRLAGGVSVNGSSNGVKDYVFKLDLNMVVRVNHEKLAVALRSQHLVELAEKRIGIVTSAVYSKLLEMMEDRIPRCRKDPSIDDPDSHDEIPEIRLQELSNQIPKEIDLSQGIAKASRREEPEQADSDEEAEVPKKNKGVPVKSKKDSDSEDDTFRPLSPASNKVSPENKNSAPIVVDKRVRMEQTRQHLLLLAGDRRRFVRSVGNAGNNAWTVDFVPLGEALRDDEVDALTWAKFREKGVRLIHVLREKGRLDEKLISTIALMKLTEVRSRLVEMQMAGLVDIQEVPKDAGRVTNRSFFLWYYDGDRVAKLVTDNIYKAMSRSLQRLDVERYRDKEAIETSERTDVNGNLELLSADTGAKLTRFLKKEELLTGLMVKLDKTAAVFREY